MHYIHNTRRFIYFLYTHIHTNNLFNQCDKIMKFHLQIIYIYIRINCCNTCFSFISPSVVLFHATHVLFLKHLSFQIQHTYTFLVEMASITRIYYTFLLAQLHIVTHLIRLFFLMPLKTFVYLCAQTLFAHYLCLCV